MFGNVSSQQVDSTWQEASWKEADWQEADWQEADWQEAAWHAPSSHSRASRAEVLATAPWKRQGDSDDDEVHGHNPLVKGGVAAPTTPPLPTKLVAARAELSSSNSSDDWGWWKSEKHRRVTSDESIQFSGGVVAPLDVLPRVGPKVGIDWLGVIQSYGELPAESLAAIQKLFDHGVEVCVLSWCVEQVGQQYLATARELPFFDKFSTFAWCDKRTGEDGKVEHWADWGCNVVIDKGEDICKEAIAQGMHVFPVQVGQQQHEWFTEMGHNPSPDLVHAVDQLLEIYFPSA